MNEAYGFLLLMGAATVFFAVVIIRAAKSKPASQRIEEWAQRAGVQLVRAERRYFLKGPFWYYRHAVVYRVRVRHDREEKDGWLRLGGSLIGEDFEQIKWSRQKNA